MNENTVDYSRILIARTVEVGEHFRVVKFLIDVFEYVDDRHPEDPEGFKKSLTHIELLTIKTLDLQLPENVQMFPEWLDGQTLMIAWRDQDDR